MTQDQIEERELFLEQAAKDVISLLDSRGITYSEMFDICCAIAEAIDDDENETRH